MALDDLKNPFSKENINHTPIEPRDWSVPKSNLTPLSNARTPDQKALRKKKEDLKKLSEDARKEEFEKFDQSGGFGQAPYILTRPDSQRLNIPRGNHAVPGRKALEDQIAQREYFLSPQGLLFNAEEGLKQSRNMRRLTRFYNPNAVLESSFHMLISQERHIDMGSKMGYALDKFSRFAGVGEGLIPRDASFSSELEAVTGVDRSGRPWGYNYFQSPEFGDGAAPGATINATNLVGRQYQNITRQNLAARASMVSPDKYSLLPSGPRKLEKKRQEILDGAHDHFLGMKEFRGSDGRYRFDLYNPTAPYVTNTTALGDDGETVDAYKTPDGQKDLNNIGFLYSDRELGAMRESYLPLKEKTQEDAEEARENPFPFRLQGETPYANWDELPRDTDYNTSREKEKFYQDQFVQTDSNADYVIKHRQSDENIITAGLPNYSDTGGPSIDAINSLPIQDWDGSEEINVQVEDSDAELARDMILFRFYDVVNNKRLLFRSYISSINFSNNINWSSTQYAGRPEKYHVYGGNSRQLNFSFVVYPESEFAFERVWKKVNYLEGLTYPSNYKPISSNGGAFMTPPFMKITIGDLLRQAPGFFQSFDISISDESTWETKPGKQLPKHLELQCTYELIEEKSPRTGDAFFDANFIKN